MKGILKQSIAWLLMAVMIVSIVPATSVSAKNKGNVKGIVVKNVKNKKLELEPKQSFRLKVKVKKKGAVSEKVTYASSKKSVAMVNKSGKIKAVKEGKAVITIKSVANSKKKTRIKVVVRKKETDTTTQSTTQTSTTESTNATTQSTTQTSTTESTTDKKDEVTKPSEDKKNEEQKPSEDDKQDKPEKPEKPENPEKKDLSYEGYTLKWKDEFDGEELNRNDWNVETHEPGWVNKEWQAYVDNTENIYVKDGKLVIKPVEKDGENGEKSYTSGRVNTQGKHDFTYGLFETRVKVPTGKGYLPAFWMMPANENLYGQWPRCGEIDIMEVMGQETNKAYGTIHYGNPHGQKQGTYTLDGPDFASEYHTFTVEWEPGKIVWYVDGMKYHEAKDWYSTTEGQGTVAYPAPFDQPFYMILNLAIGGSWVGYPDENTTYADQALEVDYVRAYQKDQKYYDDLEASVEKPAQKEVVEPEAGQTHLKNGDFSKADDLSGKGDSTWKFETQQGGEGNAAIVDDEKLTKAVKISTTEAGTEDYSIQFVQPNVPVKQGGTYKVTFDAYAASERTMKVGVSAPDYNYARYMQDTVVNLTTEKQTYTYEFTVKDHDDANARLEFNLGKTASTADVYIGKVAIVKTGSVEIDNSKKVLTDGNYVYNGKFQEGTEAGKKYMQYWTIENKQNKEVSYKVTGVTDNRRLKVTTKDCEDVKDITVAQTELPLTPGKYELTFDAVTENNEATIKVLVAGEEQEFVINKDSKTQSYKFEVAKDATIADIDDIKFYVGVNDTVYLDNISIVEDTLIKNGSFNAGLAGYEVYANTPGNVSYVVDSQSEDNAFDITIKDTGEKDFHIQLKQNAVALEKDKCYRLTFDIKSSIDRKVSYAIQRNGLVYKNKDGGEDWTPYVQNEIDVSNEYQTVNVPFKMSYDTDTAAIFNIAMGAVGGKQIQEQHRICIDNINLEEIDESEMPKNVNMLDQMRSVVNDGTTFNDGEFTITGDTGKNNWDIQYAQQNLALVKGHTYKVTYTITSSVDRVYKMGLRDPEQEYKGFYSDIPLTANESYTFEEEIEWTENSTETGEFMLLLGTPEGGEKIGPHTIKISDVSAVKVDK